MLADLVAMRNEFVARIRANVDAAATVLPIGDVNPEVLDQVIKDLNGRTFVLVCIGDEVPSDEAEGKSGEVDDEGAQLLEHEISIIIGVNGKLEASIDTATEEGLRLRQDVKAALRSPWHPSQSFGQRSPSFHGANRITRTGRYKGFVLYGSYYSQVVYE